MKHPAKTLFALPSFKTFMTELPSSERLQIYTLSPLKSSSISSHFRKKKKNHENFKFLFSILKACEILQKQAKTVIRYFLKEKKTMKTRV